MNMVTETVTTYRDPDTGIIHESSQRVEDFCMSDVRYSSINNVFSGNIISIYEIESRKIMFDFFYRRIGLVSSSLKKYRFRRVTISWDLNDRFFPLEKKILMKRLRQLMPIGIGFGLYGHLDVLGVSDESGTLLRNATEEIEVPYTDTRVAQPSSSIDYYISELYGHPLWGQPSIGISQLRQMMNSWYGQPEQVVSTTEME